MMNFTSKEMEAARVLIRSCLDGIGGEHPADLLMDFSVWVDLIDLTDAGYSRHEAAGLMSSLNRKGFIVEDNPNDWSVSEGGVSYMMSIWY